MTPEAIIGLIGLAVTAGGAAGGFGVWVWKGGGKWQALNSRLGGIEHELGRVADEIALLRETKEEQAERLTRVEGRVDENTRRLDRIKAP